MYATTVPSNFYSHLTKANLQDGFASRLTVFESYDPRPKYRDIDIRDNPMPRSIIDGFNFWKNAPINVNEKSGNLEKVLKPEPLIVTSTKNAKDVFCELEDYAEKRIEEIRNNGDDPAPFTRVVQTAQKIALIRACGIKMDNPEITEDDALWGKDLSITLLERFLKRVDKGAPENKKEDSFNRVLSYIKKRTIHKKDTDIGDVTNAIRTLDRKDAIEVIKTLLISKQIIEIKIKNKDGKEYSTYQAIHTT